MKKKKVGLPTKCKVTDYGRALVNLQNEIDELKQQDSKLKSEIEIIKGDTTLVKNLVNIALKQPE